MNDHPYTLDRWATPDDPEHCVVRFSDLRKMERACQGIWAIARIVGSNINELDTSSTQPLDSWVASNMLGGIESLCDHLANLVESALGFEFTDAGKPVH